MPEAIDPVCGMGMELDPGQVEAQSTYRGTAYSFCSEECRRLFDENPEQYVGATESPAGTSSASDT